MDDSQVLQKRGYTLGISVGEGSYAKVKSAYSERLKTTVAVKIMNKKKSTADFLEKFLPRELEILASLSHPNIIKIFEIFETSEGNLVFMIMELGAQGDLLDFIKTRGGCALPEDFSNKLFGQLSRAMKYAHDKDVVHRDLKCENLLLDKDFNLKVTDFGFARRISYHDDGQMILSKTFCGSAAYAAPEVLEGIPYNPKVYDVWSMGVVLFIMLCGCMPYDDSNIKKMLKMQKKHSVHFPRSKSVPSECKDLIHRMLNPDVTQRIEIDVILEHAWMQGKCKSHQGNKKYGPSTSKGANAEESDPKPTESKDIAGPSERVKEKAASPVTNQDVPADS